MKSRGGDGRALDKTDNQVREDIGSIADALRSFVERIERLEEEKRALAADIGDIKKEAKSAGFDLKVLAFLIRERRKDPDDVAEFNAILETYKRALSGQEESL